MPPTDTTDPPRELRPRPSRAEIDPAAMRIIDHHGGEVMAVARRWAETPEDAEDAYQRGLEIMLTKAPSTDPDHLVPWLKTVVKREAWAVRRQRERHTPSAPSPDALDEPGIATAHDHAELHERLRHGAEAMHRLKPQEVRALALRAEGLSYREICAETGWTYTKVNRCLAEGRRRFADRLAGIESGAECDRLAPQLSALADGEARAEDMALLRPHLRTCLVCRARLRDYRAAPAKVAALSPPVAATGWLTQLVAGHKLVAVLASTAALAGGGAATVAGVSEGEPRRAPAAATPAGPAAPQPPPRAALTPAAARDERRPRRERAPGRAAARAQAAPSARPPATPPAERPDPSAPGGEFTPDAPAPAPPRTRPNPPAEHEAGGGEFAP